MPNDYELLDSGNGAKLERFGPVILDRPCAQAIWKPALPRTAWERATAAFDRREGNRWTRREALPAEWRVNIQGIVFKLSGTDFGHLGVFPEQSDVWAWISTLVRHATGGDRKTSVLNLFAYSGGATLAAAKAGAEVCHLDASRGMVEWARENAALNGLTEAPIRWIVEDVRRFLQREIRRGRRYDAIILDPPTFGRGREGEVYKIERDLVGTLEECRSLLSDRPLFVLLSSHTPACSACALANLLQATLTAGRVESGEMLLRGTPGVLPVPSGSYARWSAA